MKRSLLTLLLIGVLWATGQTRGGAEESKEATFQGKPLSEWIKRLKDKEPEVRQKAANRERWRSIRAARSSRSRAWRSDSRSRSTS